MKLVLSISVRHEREIDLKLVGSYVYCGKFDLLRTHDIHVDYF